MLSMKSALEQQPEHILLPIMAPIFHLSKVEGPAIPPLMLLAMLGYTW